MEIKTIQIDSDTFLVFKGTQYIQINVEDIKLQLAKESDRYIDTEGRVTILEKNQAGVMSKLSLSSKVE